ncbi:MAG: hypothetical protein M3552_16420 [Planctomycetota bacterium]|nr:hypothetical protein [Planctomycetota bacterium]
MRNARAVAAATALAGATLLSSATVALGICTKECGYVDAAILQNGSTRLCFRYPDAAQCEDDVYLTLGESGSCEYTTDHIPKFKCTKCDGICGDVIGSQEASADHDSCEQVTDSTQGYCHAEGGS